MKTMPIAWTPGEGGLLALVPPDRIPTLMAEDLPPDARPVMPLHITLLRSASMAALVPVLGAAWASVRPTLPPVPVPRFRARLHMARRPPHPVRDPPGTTRPRHTWFILPEDAAPLRAALDDIVGALDAASRARGGPAFPHPEPERLFHVSVFNDRGGDARRSIGDIGIGDCGSAGVL